MKKYKTFFLLITFLSIMQFGVSEASSSSILKYSICKNNVAKAIVNNHHALYIMLTPSASEKFAKLTGNNIGHRLEILFKNKVVVSAIIEGRINSGDILLQATSNKEAVKLRTEILNYAPKQSCGVVSKTEQRH